MLNVEFKILVARIFTTVFQFYRSVVGTRLKTNSNFYNSHIIIICMSFFFFFFFLQILTKLRNDGLLEQQSL